MKTNRMLQLVALAALFLSGEAQAFYNPSTGRWLSRDPIEEDGGPNINAAISNDPANRVDAVGAKTVRLGVGFDSSVKFGPSVVKAFNGQLKFLFDMFFHCWTENKDCSCRLSESLPAVSIEWDFSTAIRAPADGIYNLLGDGYNLLVNNAKSIKGGRIKYLYTNARFFYGARAVTLAGAEVVGVRVAVPPYVMAHELGHVAGYEGPAPNSRSWDRKNLMYEHGGSLRDCQWCRRVIYDLTD